MVLEALAAVGLAGSIVQFVSFSSNLFSQTKQIRSSVSGLPSDLDNLATITTSLNDFCDTFSQATAQRSQDRTHAALQDLAAECGNASIELSNAIDRVRRRKLPSKLSSFRACLKYIWSQRDIEEMANRVNSFRTALILQLEVMTNVNTSNLLKTLDTQQGHAAEGTAEIGSQLQSLKQHVLSSLVELHRDLSSASTQISSRVDSLSLDLLESKDNLSAASRYMNVLRMLWFPSVDSRECSIREAHPQSCERAFTEKVEPWCSSPDPIFWLSGKPGSGKSTMMKYLTGYSGTILALKKWAGDRRMIIASHYFWIGGTEIQRSQEGLLRSILYRILQQEPSLIEVALPERWSNYSPEPWKNDISLKPFFSIKELQEAFQNLASVQGSKFCYTLFVDGLDEFNGDKDDLIGVVQSLASTDNVKLVIASRPWNVFESAFGKNPANKLYLQDLNEEAIYKYVHDNLESLDEFQLLRSEEVKASEITQEIVKDAQGVFLWVFLVVRSLREGIKNFDRLVDLQRRLREFPKDLDSFFRQMFDSMEPIYRNSAARTFQIASRACSPLGVLTYWWADVEETDKNFLANLTNRTEPRPVIQQREFAMGKRINGRLKGLMEVKKSRGLQKKLEFLHRTVADFLMTKEMTEALNGHVEPNFEPSLTICRGMLADLKTNPFFRRNEIHVRRRTTCRTREEVSSGCATALANSWHSHF